jgi:hypothetical protein
LLAVVVTGAYVMARSVSRSWLLRDCSPFRRAVSASSERPDLTHQFIELLDEPVPRTNAALSSPAAPRAGDATGQSLLDFGRMEAGAHPFRMETLTLAPLAGEVIREFQRDGGADDFRFDLEAGPGDDPSADWKPLRGPYAVCWRTPSSTRATRRVTVGVRREHDTVVISVRDEAGHPAT